MVRLDSATHQIEVRGSPVLVSSTVRTNVLDGINSLHDPDVAVEHVLVIVVLGLDDLVADLEPPSKALEAGLAGFGRVQYL